MTLLHLVGRDEWALARAAGTYAPASLAAEGFIHFSTAEQLAGSAARFFAGRDDLVVVAVDQRRLAAPLRFDQVGGDGEAFPHLYGPLNLDAVIDVTPWPPPRRPLSGKVPAMSESLQAVRGMNDLLPPDSAKWGFFERRCRQLFERHGYEEIRTPVVEHTALFARGIGEATDIVEKEMYTFLDRKQRSLTMRPEMTASCVRAYIEHAVGKREPVTRWYYSGPMFRYERMQTGRYRQFFQIGVECFGVAEPTVEAEQIAMLVQLYDGLGVPALSTLVNSVGGAEDRPRYREALLAYLEPRASGLCADCQRRLATNPLRVLDCKVDAGSEVLAGAPRVIDSLTDASRTRFDAACQALTDLGVGFRIEPRLVRGLDYYTGLVFEIQSASPALGSQTALVGGGRYDELVESMGGPPTPAVGFALGVERGILALPGPAESFLPRPHLFVAALGEAARRRALILAHSLRVSGLRIELEHRAVGVKAQLKRADKLRARAALVLGDDELASGRGKLRDMTSGQEREVALADLAVELTRGDPGGELDE